MGVGVSYKRSTPVNPNPRVQVESGAGGIVKFFEGEMLQELVGRGISGQGFISRVSTRLEMLCL